MALITFTLPEEHHSALLEIVGAYILDMEREELDPQDDEYLMAKDVLAHITRISPYAEGT